MYSIIIELKISFNEYIQYRITDNFQMIKNTNFCQAFLFRKNQLHIKHHVQMLILKTAHNFCKLSHSKVTRYMVHIIGVSTNAITEQGNDDEVTT